MHKICVHTAKHRQAQQGRGYADYAPLSNHKQKSEVYMANEFVTIKQAAKITGKHDDTIRRLIKANDSSPHIVRGKKGQYLLNRSWLVEQYEQPGADEATRSHQSGDIGGDELHAEAESNSPKTGSYELGNGLDGLIKALQDQLTAKDQQIEGLQQIIKEKEANTTKLQDQFQRMIHVRQLPEAGSVIEPTDPVVEATEPKKPESSKGGRTRKRATKSAKKSKTSTKPKQTKPATKKQKKWWQR
jgi:hypothetical protein